MAVTLLALYVALARLHSPRLALQVVATLATLAAVLALFLWLLATTWGTGGGGWRPVR